MEIGNKILELRKKNNFSQEGLAEKVGVTRQTISKWELAETAPDVKQAKELAKIFNVSLDELVGNEVNNILAQKVSNTERLAEISIKLLKAIGIFLLSVFIITTLFISINLFTYKSIDNEVIGKYTFNCTIDNEEYLYEIHFNKKYQIIYAGGDNYVSNHTDVDSIEDANKAKAHIEDWFKEHNGKCTTEEYLDK